MYFLKITYFKVFLLQNKWFKVLEELESNCLRLFKTFKHRILAIKLISNDALFHITLKILAR